MGKEERIAQHIRKDIFMCTDAMTTSPMESMNDLIKNKQRLSSNHNLSRSLERIVIDQSLRYEQHVNRSFMEMNKTVLASRSPTKHDIHRRCQYMIDYLHDRSRFLKCVQTSECDWICWNFIDTEKLLSFYDQYNIEDEDYDMSVEVTEEDLHSELKCPAEDEEFISSLKVPTYLNVYRQTVTSYGGRFFMKCSCQYHLRYVQCACCTVLKARLITEHLSYHCHQGSVFLANISSK
jgi:hypothetical protein